MGADTGMQSQRVKTSRLNTSLLSACQLGYIFLVYELVELGANVETRDRYGNTPLLICAQNGFTIIASFLVQKQVKINATNFRGNTALMLAIGRSRSMKMVKLLLAQSGINVNHQNREGYTALMKAIEAIDLGVIKLLLDSQKNAAEVLNNIRNCKNETSQEIADKLGIGRFVKLLSKPEYEPMLEAVRAYDVVSLDFFINYRLYDSSKTSMIFSNALKEIFRKHEKSNDNFSEIEHTIIQKLLEHGAKVNGHDFSPHPIVIATKVGNSEVLQLLLEHHANFCSSAFPRQEDPIKIAAKFGRIDLIQLLLQYTAVQGLKYSHVECALKYGHTDCARYFVRHGVNLDIKMALRSAVIKQRYVHVRFLMENFQTEVIEFAFTQDMDSLLVIASLYGNLGIIGLLLSAGANVNCVVGNKTPLMEAKNAEVVYYLVQRGAAVTPDYPSPLTHILSRDDDLENFDTKETIVEALLICGACVDGNKCPPCATYGNIVGVCVNKNKCDDKTPLTIALLNRESIRIVQILLKWGAPPLTRDSSGNTSLLLAAEANNTENIVCLLQFFNYDARVINAKNYYGVTALFVASVKCNLEVVKHLVNHGADVNIRDVSGSNALLHVMANFADNKSEEILITLINAGSDIHFQNKAGFSPLLLASAKGLLNVVMLLINTRSAVNQSRC